MPPFLFKRSLSLGIRQSLSYRSLFRTRGKLGQVEKSLQSEIEERAKFCERLDEIFVDFKELRDRCAKQPDQPPTQRARNSRAAAVVSWTARVDLGS